MGFFSNIAKGFGFGGSSNIGRRAAEQIRIANAEARKEVERIFGVSEDKFSAQQQQFRDDFLRQRGLTEEGFQPFIEAGTGALQDVQQGATVGGLDERIAEILGTETFGALREERFGDINRQLASAGLSRSGAALEEISNITPDLAFQIENQLFGRARDLSNVGFQGVGQRGQLGNQLTLGQGGLASGLTSLEEQIRAQFGGRVSDLITGTGKAESSGILADQAINQQRIQNLINLIGAATGAGQSGGGGGAAAFAGGFGGGGGAQPSITGIGAPLRGPGGQFFSSGISTGQTGF